MANQTHNEFLERVFPAELEEISQRRKNAGLDEGELSPTPGTDNELAGLALSGGGIRSATFSLGVIQSLCRHGLLKRIDILSTVSGGGYIGSCVSNLLNDPKNGTEPHKFPLRFTDGSWEERALTHLRNCSNYLAPSGLLTKLRLPNLMLRGILLNLFVFLPFIMALVFLTEVAYEKGPHWDNLHFLIKPLIIAFVVMALAFPFSVKLLRRHFDWKKRNAYELVLTVPLLLAGILLVTTPFLYFTRMAIEHTTGQFWETMAQFTPDELWQTALIVLGVSMVFMLAGKASENVNNLLGKLLLLLVALLGPAIILSIFLFLCLWQIDSPFLNIGSTAALNKAVDCNTPCIASGSEFQTAASRKAQKPEPDNIQQSIKQVLEEDTGAQSVAQLIHELQGRTLSFDTSARVFCMPDGGSRFGSTPCPDPKSGTDWHEDERVWLIDNSPGVQPACEIFDRWDVRNLWYTDGRCTYIYRTSEHSLRIIGAQLHLFDSSEDYWFFGVLVALLLINRFLLDINITSPHGFYRDRLSKAFLFRLKGEADVEPADEAALSTLNGPDTVAPYHIINVTLNLQGSKDPDLRGRESDFFIFSKRFTGSDRTGYTETATMEEMDRHLDLATAMAISGAAAAPNMGTTTNRSLVFIMTLLNIRLGYWLPNPDVVNRHSALNKLGMSSAQPTLVLKEAMGWLNAKGSHVNISDGGHIENLGIYPLLKRKCKFIVAVDGEADPDMSFNGLVTLMRYARIDMGIEIRMDLDEIRKNEHGLSTAHSTLGEIHYANGEKGHLLYIKLSVTGDEPEYVRAYRARNRDYPHESTADQFFSEDQFEAYRALGEHACEVLLADLDSIGPFAGLEDRDTPFPE